MLSNAAGQTVDMSGTLKTFPVELTSVEEFAKSTVKGIGMGV